MYISGVGGNQTVPIHRIHLECALFSGYAEVGLVSKLPIRGISLLLGNDIAGNIVTVSDFSSSCAITRSKSKKLSVDDEIVDLSDSFISHGKEVTSVPVFEKRSTLIEDQSADPSLHNLFSHVLTESELSELPIGYYIKSGVLMRKWSPSDSSPGQEWNERHQIVVPVKYRSEILALAHSLPLSGHLGVNKTHDKITRHFYWPGIRKSVSDFVKTCHTCQVIGKPNQTIPKAPLQPIPAFEEPFSRIIIDCVGPLPKTRSGHQYLLTIMCASSRYPEAIPLRSISARIILKELVKFFTTYGFPKEIQSDQGSNFMSNVFQQLMYELEIHQIRSTAYHPESQGALERFHQSLKSMMRTYCSDHPNDWDEAVPLLLFAARESVQETLGFSPFELVFGHTIRGPLKILKEQWLGDDTPGNLLEYIVKFRQRLFDVRGHAAENLKDVQSNMKEWYDRKARLRTFCPGDKILLYLPTQGNALQGKFSGPYIVDSQVSDTNYIVFTPDRRKSKQFCHVNLMKPYHSRQPDDVGVAVVGENDYDTCHIEDDIEIVSPRLCNSEILSDMTCKVKHLDSSKQQDIQQIFESFPSIFSDSPGRTVILEHDMDPGGSKPIKQPPYRVSPQKRDVMREEIQYMLDHDLIEVSTSPWSSPCILVPKDGGGTRFVTDYRKVNKCLIPDCFPCPRVDDCIEEVGQAKFVTKFDLQKGYWQVPLTERAKQVSAFVTPDGLYQYKVMPFGTMNASATFQRLMNVVTCDISGCRVYIDDIVIHSNTWEEHVFTLERFFRNLAEANLSINLAKSEVGKATVTFLGYVVGQGHVCPRECKIQAIIDMPAPRNKRELQRFLGMVGFYRRFCEDLAHLSVPLTELLKGGALFIWSDECQSAFLQIKHILGSKPVLLAPDFFKPFSLAVDASDLAMGAVLMQDDQNGDSHPVAYYSKKFNIHQKNYATIEKELLAIVLALQHFEVYVSAADSQTVIYTDHNPLTYLHSMKNKNQRLMRWSIFLQDFNICIRHVKGVANIVPDLLSRLV